MGKSPGRPRLPRQKDELRQADVCRNVISHYHESSRPYYTFKNTQRNTTLPLPHGDKSTTLRRVTLQAPALQLTQHHTLVS